MTNKINMIAGQLPVIGYESIVIDGTARQLTSDEFTDSEGELAKRAVITVENARIRYRYDGTNPTTAEGHLVGAFSVIILTTTTSIQNFRAIRQGANSATIRVTYEG